MAWKETHITVGNVTRSIKGWAKANGLNPRTISTRIHKGWSVEDAVTTPVRGQKRSKAVPSHIQALAANKPWGMATARGCR